jgi:hypothetical protein
MDLIGAHPASFIATDHVSGEIADIYPIQQARYHAALAAGYIGQQRVDDPAELEIFLRLAERGRLGAGERSAIAAAINGGYAVAIDDSPAIRRAIEEARVVHKAPLTIVKTQDIIIELIKCQVLSVVVADKILLDWATNHRFRLKITSFQELL